MFPWSWKTFYFYTQNVFVRNKNIYFCKKKQFRKTCKNQGNGLDKYIWVAKNNIENDVRHIQHSLPLYWYKVTSILINDTYIYMACGQPILIQSIGTNPKYWLVIEYNYKILEKMRKCIFWTLNMTGITIIKMKKMHNIADVFHDMTLLQKV